MLTPAGHLTNRKVFLQDSNHSLLNINTYTRMTFSMKKRNKTLYLFIFGVSVLTIIFSILNRQWTDYRIINGPFSNPDFKPELEYHLLGLLNSLTYSGIVLVLSVILAICKKNIQYLLVVISAIVLQIIINFII